MSSPNGTARRVKREPGIYTRPDGQLEIGWRDAQGVQRWRKVDGGITAARRALAQEHARRARGERVAADPRLTFSDAAQAWWGARVVKLRTNTQSAYGAGLAHLKAPEHFGRSRLSEITPTDVARYVSAQQAAGLKGWTIKGHLTVLSSVFTYAARHLGYVGTNPVSLLDSVERPSTDDEKPKRILSGDELGRLLEAVSGPYRLIFDLAAETGARLAETLGLAWEDIDLDGQTISFSHQLDRKGKRQPLKTKRSRRCLEITPRLANGLRAHKLASADTAPHGLVFVTREGTGHDHRNIGGRVMARGVKAAGLQAVEHDGEVIIPAPTFHDLRHSHASALIAQGWDIEEVSARLGHANVATTQRIYVHQFDAAKRSPERRSRLASLYGSAMEASDGSSGQQTAPAAGAAVVQLSTNGDVGLQAAAG
jgi:integrase